MDAHVADRADFGLIRYANCWEDADVLCDALGPCEGKRVLSIASAGDNTLALLAAGAEVVAADISLAQLACVELRCAAFRNLEHDALLAFLGVRPADNRRSVFARLQTDLTPAARRFWDGQARLVDRGVIHAGKFERYFHGFRRFVLPLVHNRKTVTRLLEEKGPDSRREFYEKTWNTRRWRWLFHLFFSRFAMGRLGRDPEFFRYVEGSVADRILARTRHALTELSTHDNPYLTYILTGNYGEALPRYLRSEHFDAVRAGLDRLTIFAGTVEQAAEAHAGGGFDGFNLSDIFEYLDEETSREIYMNLLDHARANARFAYWNMLVPRRRPEAAAERVETLDVLSRHLHARDRAFFYQAFVVEGVR
jgi:S-adenosylmethionine-diacylglycerol 3-amino-3-carboxypropyl transferase